MTDHPPPVKPRGTIGALKNVAGFFQLVKCVQERSMNLPNIGVMHGRPGDGKTFASIFAQNKTRAIRVEAGDSWNRKEFLNAVLLECGVPVQKGSIAELANRAVLALSEDMTRPLIIDEADKVVRKGYIELVREISMKSNIPVLLIGEENLPEDLAAWPRVYDRVLSWYGAVPCDLEDARKLAELLLAPVSIDDALLEDIRRRGDGRARRIATSLNNVAHWAKNMGVTEVTLRNYSGVIHTGKPQKNRAERLKVPPPVDGGRA